MARNKAPNSYKVGRGTLAFNLKRADGTYEGFRDLGNCPGFTVTVESETLDHENSQSGLAVRDLSIPIRVTRSATLTVDNMDPDNTAMFCGATVATATQATATVTGFAINKVQPFREYEIGTTVAGVRNVSAVTVTVSAAARANSTAYTVGAIYAPATPNGRIYLCTIAGTSAASPPTFTTDGTAFTDGTATFKDLGLISSLAEGTDYLLDATYGRIGIPKTGKIAGVWNSANASQPSGTWSINLLVDYTAAAVSWEQIATGTGATLTGKLELRSDNPSGNQQDFFAPEVTLSPNGELPFITADEFASVEFSVGINQLDPTVPAFFLFGRPVV